MVPLHHDGYSSGSRRDVLSDWPLSRGGECVMSLVFMIFTVQIVLGALDNFWHHEITERLPAKRAAATELSWHAVREGLYGAILFGLAWYEWRGAWAVFFAAMLLAEILTTLADFIVEDQTRKLPRFERVLHTILAM